MNSPNINRMAHKANSLGETMPVAELYASSDIKTKKQTGKNRKLCRKDLKDEGKMILGEKYIHASLVHKAPG